MIRSMTGFGVGRGTSGDETLTVEIRSVNGKYCEVRPRAPRELASLEQPLVRRVRDRLARGNVDVTVRRGEGRGTLIPIVDEALAERLGTKLRALKERLDLQGDIQISDLLGVEGIVTLEEPAVDLEQAKAALFDALDEALDKLLEMREREGALLLVDLEARVEALSTLHTRLVALADRGIASRQERTEARIQEILGEVAVDPQRLAQELAILAERGDITEELTRLRSHLDHFGSLLHGDEPAGRRLDFLTQEMNREANTIASKATWLDSAELVVEMKAEIDRLREQIQNIE